MSGVLPFAMPPPVALARTAPTLPPHGVPMARFEPKFDGYRAVWGAGRLWSRRGTDLSGYFPDLLPALRHLPDDLVLDGELIAWNTETGRLDFASLQERLRAGRRLCDVAAARPAQMVCFDLLACGGSDLRGRELTAAGRARARVGPCASGGGAMRTHRPACRRAGMAA